jgi:hypothetical protein
MFTGHDHVLTAKGDADHGWLGCSTTDPGQSLDGRKKLLYPIFPILPLLPNALLFLTLRVAPSPGRD